MKKHLLIILIILLLSACSSVSNGRIVQVTPLPTRDAHTPTPTIQIESAVPTPTRESDTPTPIVAINPTLPTLTKESDTQTPTIEIEPTATLNPTLVSINLTRAVLPTSTHLAVRMAQGEALEIIRSTDEAMVYERETIDEDEPVKIGFDDFYDGYDEDTGPIVSERLKELDGRKVLIQGYMAPPLDLDLDWFLLTIVPVGGCAFCGSSLDVSAGTAMIYPVNESVFFTGNGVHVTGTVEVGDGRDPATGMASLIRIYADDIDVEID